jgi:hypothetical protein
MQSSRSWGRKLEVFSGVVAVATIVAAAHGCADDSPYEPECGDGFCESPETQETCPGDCGEPGCGDGSCESPETQETCPEDCGEPGCGDGECVEPETTESCPTDCPAPSCGDGVCDFEGSEPVSCTKDCCGDGFCDPGEEKVCPVDCDAPGCPADTAVLSPVIDPAILAAHMVATRTGIPFTPSDGRSMAISMTYTDVSCIGAMVAAEADLDLTNLECGAFAGGGEVHCPAGSVPSAPGDGDHLLLAIVLDDPVPLADPLWHMQFGFVFDSDGLPENNWVPLAAFPLDFFGGSDLWIELLYDPTSGFVVRVSDIDAGNVVTPRAASAAKVVLVGSVLLAIIPLSEVGAGDGISYRGSAFKHQGGFLAGPWNGDAYPAPPAALAPVD